VAALAEVRRGRIPGRQGDLLHCLRSGLRGGRDQLGKRGHSLEIVVLNWRLLGRLVVADSLCGDSFEERQSWK